MEPEERIVRRKDWIGHVPADDVVSGVVHARTHLKLPPEGPVGVYARRGNVHVFSGGDGSGGWGPGIQGAPAVENRSSSNLERGLNPPYATGPAPRRRGHGARP